MRHYKDPCLLSLEALEELGRKFAQNHPSYYDQEVARGSADDIAIIAYTSGTTGQPKGTMLSHRNLIVTARNGAEREGVRQDEEDMAYLPMVNAGTYQDGMWLDGLWLLGYACFAAIAWPPLATAGASGRRSNAPSRSTPG